MKAQRWRRIGAVCVLLLVAWAVALTGLSSTPPVWWDEGWTLSVARNFAERGLYGRMLDGTPTSPTLAAAPPITLLVGFGFKAFGAGIWQGRLVMTGCMLLAFALMAHLALRYSGRRASVLVLALLLLGFGSAPNHPLLMGRQVLGELPMLAYLLGGYAAFWVALRRERAADKLAPLLLAVLLWALGIMAKRQAVPFWAASLGLPLLLALLRREWRPALLLAIGLGGSYALMQALLATRALWLPGYVSSGYQVQQLEASTAIVLTLPARLAAARMVLLGLPVLIGGAAALPGLWADVKASGPAVRALPRQMLFVLAGSWFAWFAATSIGWPRYAFPWLFLGTLFAADALSRWTRDRDWRAIGVAQPRRPLLAAMVLALAWLGLSARAWASMARAPGDDSAQAMARTVAVTVSANARIATYESEMIFLLDQPMLYPPDAAHVDLIRRRFIDPSAPLTVDALAGDPDYLLLGPFAVDNDVYSAGLKRGDFQYVQSVGPYELYRRRR